MAMSRRDAIRATEHRLSQQQPGRPLAMARDIAATLLAAAKDNMQPPSTEAEKALRRWGLAMAVDANHRMAPSMAMMRESAEAARAVRRLALELAGVKPQGEEA